MKRACLERGCPNLIVGRTRCQSCTSVRERARNLRRAPEVAFYGSASWQALARRTVASAWCCAHCGATGEKLTADHVLTLRARPDLALAEHNVVASCRSCQLRRQYQPGGGRSS